MRKESNLLLAIAVFLFVIQFGMGLEVWAGTASFQGLGDLPGGQFFSYACGISADGSVVVGSGRPGPSWQAYRWTESTGMQGLGAKPTGDADSSEAWGASADGAVVVGYVGLYGTPSEAFRWTVNGMVGLGYLGGGDQSEAYDVSGNGSAVVGWSTCTLGTQAYRWTSGSGMVGLGDLPGRQFMSVAYGISDDGSVVVGYSSSSGSIYGWEAFRWSESSGMVGLGNLPGGTSSYARNVSGDGAVVVGECHTALGVEAFRWTESDGMQGLGDLAGGDFYSKALGVSADGSVIVGESVTSTDYYEAFIWDELHGMRNLKDVLVNEYNLDLTSWTLYGATGISADGLTIAGYGRDPSGNGEGWIARLNTVPVACVVGGDRVVEAGSDCEARVVLDGSCSSDADSTPGTNDDINDFDWYDVVDVCDPNSDIFLGSGEIIECNLPLGEHTIILEVTDKAGAFDANEVTITVEDTTPPEFSLSVVPDVLWPANHKMVEITPSWEVSDNCDEWPEVTLVSITMNEDGAMEDDIQIGDEGIWLRAERSGKGDGRVYTITYQAVDDSGNITVRDATVTVPHDQKRGRLRRRSLGRLRYRLLRRQRSRVRRYR